MENGRSKRTDKFFAGKGFYIVLALCIAVIGISAVSIALNSDAGKAPELDPGLSLSNPTEPIATPPVVTPTPNVKTDIEKDDGAVVSTWKSSETYEQPAAWVWPVKGEIERKYAVETLAYDVTMKDWRTHDGIDVLADKGTVVRAASDGTVESITQDDLYGTTVTIDHGKGMESVYANLSPSLNVQAGTEVDAGTVLGTVGTSAIAESASPSHLHFALREYGVTIDPGHYLH